MTITSTGMPSQSSSNTTAGTGTCTATESSSTTTPIAVTVVSTATATGTFEPSANVEPESSSSGGGSTVQELAAEYGPIVGALSVFLLCLFFVGYKRRKNQAAVKAYSTILEQYAKQQDSPLEDHSFRKREEERKAEKHTSTSSNEPFMGCQHSHAIRRVSTFAVNEANIENPLMVASASKLPDSTAPNIEILETSALQNRKGYSGIKVVSVKPPDLRKASTRGRSKLCLARIDDIDLSCMKATQRTILKLRKWKALVFAEVSPMVEIEMDEHDGNPLNSVCTSTERQEALMRRFAFANKQGGDRSVIEHGQSHSLSQGGLASQLQRKKKEFHVVPRSMARASFSSSTGRSLSVD